MKVAINATSLLGQPTGIGHYTRELLAHLQTVPEVEVHPFNYLGQWGRIPEQAQGGVRSGGNVSWLRRHVPLSVRMLARPLLVALRVTPQMRRLGIELYHEPSFFPVAAPCPVVITVQDLSYVRYPEHHMPHIVRIFNRRVPRAVERAAAVIVPSGFIRDEVLSLYGTDPAKVHVTPYAAGPQFHPRAPEEVRATLAAYDLEAGRYLLAVGTLEPRKNLIQALRAYQMLPATLREQYPLAIVGMRGWESSEFWRELTTMERSGQVRPLGYVPAAELPLLYAGAALFVYPSVYEGFGLPPLEAMASGVPVVTSDRASLPEVVGDAGVQVPPDDPQPLAEAIRRMLEDPDEAQQRVGLGLERARGFSWSRCAEDTVAVYRLAVRTH